MRFLSVKALSKPAGIAVAVLVAVAFAPGRAKAECGDYVHILPDAPAANGQPAPKAPCNGPHCSGKPAAPTAPLTIPASDSEVNELLTNGSGYDNDLNHTKERHFREMSVTLPSTIPTSIFHPPRAA